MEIDRWAIYEKYGGHCAYCGETIEFKAMQVDHIRPKRRFSVGHIDNIPKYHVDDLQNLNPACRVCNNWKLVWTVDEFRYEIEQQVKRLRKYRAQYRLAERYGLVINIDKPVIFYFERKE